MTDIVRSPQTEGRIQVKSLGNSMGRSATIAVWVAAALLSALGIWLLLHARVHVPDTSSPVNSNHTHLINRGSKAGQSFVAKANNLNRISVVLAAQQLNEQAEIYFQVKDSLHGEPLRTVKRKIVDMPLGESGYYSPATITETWYSFDFDPIPDSAGRKLYFFLEGDTIPDENTVTVQALFHGEVPGGEGYFGGGQYDEYKNAYVLFRASSAGQVQDLWAVVMGNLTDRKVGPMSDPVPYLALAFLYVLVVGAAIRTASRLGNG